MLHHSAAAAYDGIFRSKRCGARNDFLHQILTAGTIERRITLMKRTCLHCVIGKQGNFQFDTGIERCSTAQSFLAVILLLRLDIGTPVENASCAFTKQAAPNLKRTAFIIKAYRCKRGMIRAAVAGDKGEIIA